MIKKLNLRKILLHCKTLMTKNVLHSADISELYYVFFYNATVWSNWVGPSLQRFEKLSLRIRFKKSLTDFSNILVPIICLLGAQITNHFHSHFLFLETSLTQLEISSLNSDVWNLSLLSYRATNVILLYLTLNVKSVKTFYFYQQINILQQKCSVKTSFLRPSND